MLGYNGQPKGPMSYKKSAMHHKNYMIFYTACRSWTNYFIEFTQLINSMKMMPKKDKHQLVECWLWSIIGRFRRLAIAVAITSSKTMTVRTRLIPFERALNFCFYESFFKNSLLCSAVDIFVFHQLMSH